MTTHAVRRSAALLRLLETECSPRVVVLLLVHCSLYRNILLYNPPKSGRIDHKNVVLPPGLNKNTKKKLPTFEIPRGVLFLEGETFAPLGDKDNCCR